jgi:hypothetical protein
MTIIFGFSFEQQISILSVYRRNFYLPLSVVARQGPSLQKRESVKVACYDTLRPLRVTEKVGGNWLTCVTSALVHFPCALQDCCRLSNSLVYRLFDSQS